MQCDIDHCNLGRRTHTHIQTHTIVRSTTYVQEQRKILSSHLALHTFSGLSMLLGCFCGPQDQEAVQRLYFILFHFHTFFAKYRNTIDDSVLRICLNKSSSVCRAHKKISGHLFQSDRPQLIRQTKPVVVARRYPPLFVVFAPCLQNTYCVSICMHRVDI